MTYFNPSSYHFHATPCPSHPLVQSRMLDTFYYFSTHSLMARTGTDQLIEDFRWRELEGKYPELSGAFLRRIALETELKALNEHISFMTS